MGILCEHLENSAVEIKERVSRAELLIFPSANNPPLTLGAMERGRIKTDLSTKPARICRSVKDVDMYAKRGQVTAADWSTIARASAVETKLG